jgi:hypothetical protein
MILKWQVAVLKHNMRGSDSELAEMFCLDTWRINLAFRMYVQA